MRLAKLMVAAAAAVLLAACASTEEAQNSMSSQFVGQPSDSFFARHGAPYSSFKLNSGSTVYRWRGGETSVYVPAEYRTIAPAAAPGASTSTSHTTTSVSHPDSHTTVTESSTTRYGVGVSSPTQVMVTPAHTRKVFCEAQLTVDPSGTITAVQVMQDTTGAGMSFSRCAEIFGTKK